MRGGWGRRAHCRCWTGSEGGSRRVEGLDDGERRDIDVLDTDGILF